jgi:transcriptional regulator with XRE-family HTH domain
MKHEFARKLRRWRTKLKLVQKEAADRLNVSLDTYRSWEHGLRTPIESAPQTKAQILQAMENFNNEAK